ncbi:hypothetical protein [Chryseobacterium sp. SIMBA_028]|uniref:hypothetical protein n=1 Tax=Chryseobacterium sp. SIMBA_028 TaxID=3085771 RepID=UPI0039790079
MKSRVQGVLNFLVRNFLLFFQIYAIVYVFINSYIDLWFSLNREAFFEFEKVIVINFFQAEVLFLYILYNKIKNNKNEKIAGLKVMYSKYLEDMQSQGVSKRKASISMLVAVVILAFLFIVLILKSPFGDFLKLIIGLNEVMIKNVEILIPCLLLVIFLYYQLKHEAKDMMFNAANRLSTIMNSFKISIPIFIILYAVRIYFSGKTEESFVPAALLAVNLSFLMMIIREKKIIFQSK